MLLACLGLGKQLRGYDAVDYALPMDHQEIKDAAEDMQDNYWKLPPYNIQQGVRQKEYKNRTKTAWLAFEKRQTDNKNVNTHHFDICSEAIVEWATIQEVMSSALQFFRDVWILNSHLEKENAHNLAMRLLKHHISTKADRKKFFD